MLTLDEALAIAAEQNKDIQKAKEIPGRVMGRYYRGACRGPAAA